MGESVACARVVKAPSEWKCGKYRNGESGRDSGGGPASFRPIHTYVYSTFVLLLFSPRTHRPFPDLEKKEKRRNISRGDKRTFQPLERRKEKPFSVKRSTRHSLLLLLGGLTHCRNPFPTKKEEIMTQKYKIPRLTLSFSFFCGWHFLAPRGERGRLQRKRKSSSIPFRLLPFWFRSKPWISRLPSSSSFWGISPEISFFRDCGGGGEDEEGRVFRNRRIYILADSVFPHFPWCGSRFLFPPSSIQSVFPSGFPLLLLFYRFRGEGRGERLWRGNIRQKSSPNFYFKNSFGW